MNVSVFRQTKSLHLKNNSLFNSCTILPSGLNSKFCSFKGIKTDNMDSVKGRIFSFQKSGSSLCSNLIFNTSKISSCVEVSRAFGVMIEEEGIALRGRFLINPEGTVVAQEVQAPMVGRNVHEFLRQVRAWQHAEKTGEVCPAGWVPGKKTLPVNTDVEQMTGRVGDYITIEEIMA